MMGNNSFNTILIGGLAVFGLALVVAGVEVYRRRVHKTPNPLPGELPVESGSENEEQHPGTGIFDAAMSRRDRPSNAAPGSRPLAYFLLLFAITIPYWIFGGKNLPIPIKLPVSAFAAFNPMIAALILVYLHEGSKGVKVLFRKAFDYRKIKNRAWYIPIVLLSPLVYALSYAVMRLAGRPLPDPEISILMVPVFLGVFILFGIGEELGWMGYAIDPLQNRWGALKAAVVVGIIWGLFHLIPDLQNNQAADWILWQRFGTVFLRILIVWIYNNTGKSVFSSVLFHAMNNLSWALFPNFGTHYDPFVTGLILIFVTGLVLIGWDSKTLARYRYASASSQ